MTGYRQLVSIVVLACLIHVGFPQQAQAMAAAEGSEKSRQKVEQLGAGAEVLVTLRDQQKELRGTVESFDDSAFRLRSGRNGEQRTVRYVDVTLLRFTKRKYRAEGSSASDPVTVRRVAVELGAGLKVRVQTQDGKTVVGKIVKVDQEQLNLDLGTNGPISVSYTQIRELKPKGMSLAAKIGIPAAVFGVVLVASIAKCASGGCS